jgi:hypothetical protein
MNASSLFSSYAPLRGDLPMARLDDDTVVSTSLRHAIAEGKWFFHLQHYRETPTLDAAPLLGQVIGRHFPWVDEEFRETHKPGNAYAGALHAFYNYIDFESKEIESECARGALSTAHITDFFRGDASPGESELLLRLCLRQLQEIQATGVITLQLTEDFIPDIALWEGLLRDVGFQRAKSSPFQNIYAYFTGLFDGYSIR